MSASAKRQLMSRRKVDLIDLVIEGDQEIAELRESAESSAIELAEMREALDAGARAPDVVASVVIWRLDRLLAKRVAAVAALVTGFTVFAGVAICSAT